MRSLPALYQDDDDGNDLSDLGLSGGKKNSVSDDDLQPLHHVAEEREANDTREEENVFRSAEQPVAPVKVATVTATADSVAENGYDRAIKDYVDFTESKKTSVIKCNDQQKPQKPRKPHIEMKRRMSAPKIEEKVMLLKTRSQSTKDINAASSELPKVDIGKRREIFEKICLETKCVEVLQQTTISVVTKQPPPPPPPPPVKKNKPFELVPPVAVCTADVQQQVIEEISLPESPSPPPGKIYKCK